jgi:uncharacterized phage protein (TIGR02218 family)
MKYMSAGLTTYLNSLGPAVSPYVADLLTIAPVGGSIVRLTSAPVDVQSTSLHGATLNVTPVVLDATVYTFKAGGTEVQLPTFTRERIITKIGLEVQPVPVRMAVPTGATLNGTTWQAAVLAGYLDGAAITLERAFMPTWNDTSRGTVILEKGFTGECRPSRSGIELEITQALAILERPMPRRQFQPGCLHILYDAGCTLSQGTYTSTNAATAGSTASVINSTLSQADHYFELGAITFTSGVNNGLTRRVTSYLNASGAVTVVPAFPNVPGNGDTFSIYPGCDKSMSTCIAKFANLTHFAGFPFVPVAEATL